MLFRNHIVLLKRYNKALAAQALILETYKSFLVEKQIRVGFGRALYVTPFKSWPRLSNTTAVPAAFEQLASDLKAINAEDLSHNDICNDNILVDNDGVLYLIDWEHFSQVTPQRPLLDHRRGLGFGHYPFGISQPDLYALGVLGCPNGSIASVNMRSYAPTYCMTYALRGLSLKLWDKVFNEIGAPGNDIRVDMSQGPSDASARIYRRAEHLVVHMSGFAYEVIGPTTHSSYALLAWLACKSQHSTQIFRHTTRLVIIIFIYARLRWFLTSLLPR